MSSDVVALETGYPAARSHAPTLERHFARHLAEDGGGPTQGPLPDVAAIERLVDVGFWASLQREEGYAPEISLAFVPPERAVHPMLLARPLPLGARALARLAPAVERPGIHLGVWRDGDALRVWGTTRAVPVYCFVLEVVGPGLLVVKHRTHEDSGKFRNVAVFEGERVKLLSRRTGQPADVPRPLRPLLCGSCAVPDDDASEALLRLAVSMRAHKRGGTLLVVPSDSGSWKDSIMHPISYEVDPRFTELADIVREPLEERLPALARVIDAVAGLTAVDGATIVNDRLELLAFGAKIGRPEGRQRVESVVLSEPVEDGVTTVVPPLQLGGTRHSSAVQFAQDQRDAFAMVASQDGHFTVFAWSASAGLVHGYRVEALLL